MQSIVSKPFYNETEQCKNLWTADDKERAEIWNWGKTVGGVGDPSKTSKSCAEELRSERPWKLPISKWLLKALNSALYGHRFQDQCPGRLFDLLQAQANGFLNHIILRLDDGELFVTGRPISHIIVDVIAIISFLRREAIYKNDNKTQVSRIFKSRTRFWRKNLSMYPCQIFLNCAHRSCRVGRRELGYSKLGQWLF